MDNNYRLGIFYGLGAYLLWGVLPIYWKLLQHVEAMEILICTPNTGHPVLGVF